MGWVWKALLGCGHWIGDVVPRSEGFDTPVELGDIFTCTSCGASTEVTKTMGRGR